MQANSNLQLYATTPKGLELLLTDELRALGAVDAREKLAGVSFTGDLALAYKICLWSRLANRVLMKLHQCSTPSAEKLYAGVRSINWGNYIDQNGTISVNFVSTQSAITHTLFGAQKVKDAIVDQMRDKYGTRPNVDRDRPDVSVYVYVNKDIATIYLDLSGESLHKRGYRLAGGAAPLKENLAAAILIRSNWPQIAKNGGTLLDPMCGSGTLLTEAALMAADIAPGLMRDYFGFYGCKGFDANVWKALRKEAEMRKEIGLRKLPMIVGYDINPEAISIAFENIERAGLRGKIHVEKRDIYDFAPKPKEQHGLIVINPPYGERLGDVAELQPLYTCIGDRFKAAFAGWQAAVFTGNPDLGRQMGIRAKKFYSLFNGAIPCKLLLFDIQPNYFIDRSKHKENFKNEE